MKSHLPQLDPKSLGAAISARRGRAGLSQEEVAERLDIGQEAVSRLERGVAVPSLQRLLELAEVFGCGVDEFILPVNNRSVDQAVWLSKRLESLSSEDRTFVFEVIDKLCGRLKAQGQSA